MHQLANRRLGWWERHQQVEAFKRRRAGGGPGGEAGINVWRWGTDEGGGRAVALPRRDGAPITLSPMVR